MAKRKAKTKQSRAGVGNVAGRGDRIAPRLKPPTNDQLRRDLWASESQRRTLVEQNNNLKKTIAHANDQAQRVAGKIQDAVYTAQRERDHLIVQGIAAQIDDAIVRKELTPNKVVFLSAAEALALRQFLRNKGIE